MHDPLTVVTERGQTSIPAKLRDALGLRRGTRLEWERISNSEMRVRVVKKRHKPNPESMIGFGAKMPFARMKTDRYMKLMREGE